MVHVGNTEQIKGEHVTSPNTTKPRLQRLLDSYSSVFRDNLPASLLPHRSVDHAIETEPGAKPPHRPLYQLSPAELVAAKEYVVDLLQKGKIRPIRSPYGAPLFFVKTGDGGKLRGVIDYRGLNRITKKNNAPIPRTDEIFDRLGGARVFSKMDLKTGFHQIRVRPEDIEKTAFNTKYGQYEFLVLHMGLCNAPASFQSLMNSIFCDCIEDFIVVYIDDLLIYSRSEDEHLEQLRIVLDLLREHQLYVGRKKCSFMQNETEYLGLHVSADGISVGPERIQAISDWPKPTSLTELRSFLGLLQFFRRFIKEFSAVAFPLTDLTRKDRGIAKWDNECDLAFETLKTSLISAPILVSPNWSKPFYFHIDASQKAVGGTLYVT